MRLLVMVLLLVLLVLALPGKLHPATIRVPDDQPTIAAGLAAANAGDEVVLACGTYTETGLNMKPGVALRGETGSPDCVSIVGTLAQDRAIRFQPADDAVLRGLTFREGRGVAITNSSGVLIEDCDFVRNRPPGTEHGGALRLSSSAVSIVACRFDENVAAYGAAIRDEGGTLAIENSVFHFNGAWSSYGYGAILATGGGSIAIKSSQFVANRWPLVVREKACSIENSHFEANEAGVERGQRYVSGTFEFEDSEVSIHHCVFARNNNILGGAGVALYEFWRCSPATIASCVFHAEESGGMTGLISASASPIEIDRSVIANAAASPVIFLYAGATATLSCSVVWHPSSPVVLGTADTTGVFFSDPLFCNPAAGDYRVSSPSPCLPGVSPCGELIGAFGLGCGPVSVEARSWGRIKALYR